MRATEVQPERGVELETWLVEQNGLELGDDDDAPDVDRTTLWWAPLVGVTDRLELAIPVEIRHEQPPDGGMAGGFTQLYAFGVEARLLLASPDPVEAGRFTPLVRLGVNRLVTADAKARVEAGTVIGARFGSRIYAAAGLDATWFAGDDESKFRLSPSAGATVRIVADLLIGGEAYAEVGQVEEWAAIGPTVAWTHGRFWVAGTLPIGLVGVDTAPRINWGVAF